LILIFENPWNPNPMNTKQRRTVPWLAIIAAMLHLSPGTNAATLEDGFRSPPESAKPHTWWHWMNGNISREGITADLEAMAEIGLGGANIFNVSCDIPAGSVNYISPEWLGLVHHAASEANHFAIHDLDTMRTPFNQ
jgi:hypothetical protein